jgi:uncharacterized protein (DUF983 family)
VATTSPVVTSPVTVIVRGLTKRCARCGSGKLFRKWFNMKETCPKCHLRFEREEGFFLGATTMSIAVMMVAAAAVIVVGFNVKGPDGSIIPMMVAGGLVTLLLPVLIYPFSKTLWLAIDQLMRRSLGEQFSGSGEQPGFRSKREP